jgi:hypothetical protein
MRLPETFTVLGNAPFAMRELAGYLRRVTGREAGADGYPFTLTATGGESEAFRIAVTPEGTDIRSASLRGVLYGVYAFLEWQFGCRFFAADCETVPFRPDAELTAGERSSSPDFAYRELYWRGATDGRFALQCRLNSACAGITPEMGGKTMFYNYSHTFEQLVPPEKWFDTHPEDFSFVGGERRREHSQLCLTNPDVLRLCVEGVRGWIAAHPECTIFSVAQNDWYGNCECDACRAVDEREGGPAGSLIAFVNAVADAIAQDYPNVSLHTFAYLYSRKPPRTLRPRPNVIVRLCDIECCFSHPIGGCGQAIAAIDVEQGAAHRFQTVAHGFAEDLLAWSQRCDNLYIWDYTTNYSNYLQPFPNLRVYQPNLRFFRRCGVRGVFEQGNYSPGETGAFAPLKIYLLSKLLWDADADVDALTAEFAAGYYGAEAAQHVLECLTLMETEAERFHMGIFDAPTAGYLAEDVPSRADAALERALAATRDETRRTRIRRERLSFRYALLVRSPMDAPLRTQNIDAFEREARELGVTELFERRELGASFDCMRQSRYTADRGGVPYRMYRL